MFEYICPHCKNPIYDEDALSCMYCGRSLNRAIGFLGNLRYISPNIIFTIVVLAILICFIVLISR